MAYRIAGIDVHKKMLAVVISDVEVDGEYQFERIRYGSTAEHLRLLAERLISQQVEEVVMESTAQYWKPVWGALERYWKPICQVREGAGPKSGTLHLAQAQSNRGRRGRKKDFPDAERLVKRLVANELTLSFVPDAEQRLRHTAKVPTDTQPHPVAEPTGGSVGRVPHSTVQLGLRSSGCQCPPHAEGSG